jgi:Peptidase S24-like.
MKVLNLIYYVLLAFVVMVAILLIFSAFPIAGNYKIFVVQSGSMAPAIKMGSLVIVKPANDYKIGDVITFGPYSRTKAPTTHRIMILKLLMASPVISLKETPIMRQTPEKLQKEIF